MKRSINIRGEDPSKPKVGSYQHVRQQISQSAIKQIEKKSINSSTDPTKVSTTKHLRDQRKEN